MGDPRSEATNALLARARERFRDDEGKLAEGLLRHYYAAVSPDDLAGRDPDDLYGAALCHLHLARSRGPGQVAVRVYTPAVGEDGWQTAHSVVDVVADDLPFLVDSVLAAVGSEGLDVHLLAHPVLDCVRDADGRLASIGGVGSGDGEVGAEVTESLIHVELDRLPDAAAETALEGRLRDVVSDVVAAVAGWGPMRAVAEEVAAELGRPVPHVPDDERAEAQALLRYLLDDHFTFLGYREYTLAAGTVESVDGTGLGILSGAPPSRRTLTSLTPEGAALARAPVLLNLTKANAVSTVHRAERLDYVGVKRIGPDGAVLGERRFLGLFTSDVYTSSVTEVPVVRRTAEAILERCGDRASAHDRSALLSILEHHPRDELLHGSLDDLARIAEGILHLRERRRVKLFVRRDAFGRYASCLVFVPRDRYRTEIRLRIQDLLLEALGGTASLFDSQTSGGVLARVHVIVFVDPNAPSAVDFDALEARIEAVTTTWDDHLRAALIDRHGESEGLRLHQAYAQAFPNAYRDEHRPAVGVDDIARLEDAVGRELTVHVYQPLEAGGGTVRFKLFRPGAAIALTDVLPLLHDLGVTVIDERPFEIRAGGGFTAWIYDFGLRLPLGADPTGGHGRRFEDAFLAAWDGRVESDGFNRLVLTAGLTWRDVVVLRAYRRYLRQIGSTFSQMYYEQILSAHPRIVRLIVDAFAARFDPDGPADRDAALKRYSDRLDDELELVSSLDEDRMLRSFWTLVVATVRTNHFQRDGVGEPKDVLALKLDPAAVPELPLPRPAHEVFVYSPAVEGVHLRAGQVARGGVRWSERREDFRTEVLGLMKAQMVKNAVIVPVGAKGGFFAKRLTQLMSADDSRAEVVAAYRSFISGLLDVTGNLVDGVAVPPERVVCHDDDDTYLVVAADRGTATFSDIANGLATGRGFWLGDAFASGGSTGYDHKAMGITARGAWESVKRHFRELGVDVQSEPVTVVGIGDMSGDVFGNGMLLSSHLRLVGAFDHRHVFVDPDPDPEASFAERRRLFELPRSSWGDYDPAVLSAGGGVYDRTAKRIELTAPVRAALGVDDDVTSVTPGELVRHLLAAPVDLLWNGGIGTFVKASSEHAADVGDRANDAIRIDGSELRCRVVGEGGNLGLTQLARVEFAAAGGRVYSDAVDNVGGVNCSDYEVNIKILLDEVVADGDLTLKQRDSLLVEMTDEVAGLVMAENYRQTTAVSAARVQAPAMIGVHQRHLAWLERQAGLNRPLEGLPSDDELNERREDGTGLTAPELAVLLAYTKIALADELARSDLLDDPECRRLLAGYFPAPLRERYPDRIDRHPLARELIATVVTNTLVDRAGLSMVHRLAEETSAPAADIARAHLAAWRIFGLERTWAAIDALDGVVAAEAQLMMQLETKRLGERATRWLLRNEHRPLVVDTIVGRYDGAVSQLAAVVDDVLPDADRRSVRGAIDLVAEMGVPEKLGRTVAHMGLMITALDIAEIQARSGAPIERTAAAYFALDDALALAWMRERINGLPRIDRWESLARSALRDDFLAAHAELAESVVASSPRAAAGDEAVAEWLAGRGLQVGHCLSVVSDIRASGRADLAQLSVALRELRNLLQTAS